MPKKIFFGIDIGTTGAKAVFIDVGGNIIARAFHDHDGIVFPHPGWAEHDAEKVWWESFTTLSRQLLSQLDSADYTVEAIGCSALSPAMLPTDVRGRPLRRAILYGIDTRTSSEIQEMKEILGNQSLSEDYWGRISSQSVGPKILWFKKNEPHLFELCARQFIVTNYLVYRLTGEYVIDDISANDYGPFYDLEKKRWKTDILKRFDLPVDLMPEIVPVGAVVGSLSKEAASETGLPVGTPVTSGWPDGYAEYISVDQTMEELTDGDVQLTYGTTMLLSHYTKSMNSAERNPHYGSVPVRGLTAMIGSSSNGGSLLRWFRDNFALSESVSEENSDDNIYARLSKLAEAVAPGSNGLLVLPYFNGERGPLWDSKVRGVILGLSLFHRAEHIYRAILESICFVVRHHLEEMERFGAKAKKIFGIGGGTQNSVWTQIMSDITGLPQLVTPHRYGSPHGSAILAAKSVGGIQERTAAGIHQSEFRQVTPSNENHEIYEKIYPLFREAYRANMDLLHALTDLNKK